MNKKRGQVWVETVIYTLIALALIGTVLAFVKPKVEEMQDKITIDQSLQLMGDLDAKIQELTQRGVGNSRIIDLQIKSGTLNIDGINDKIFFTLEDSKYAYSQEGQEIESGNVLIKTEKKSGANTITLTTNYQSLNLTYNENDQVKTLTASPTLYKISFSNLGKTSDKIQVDVKLVN